MIVFKIFSKILVSFIFFVFWTNILYSESVRKATRLECDPYQCVGQQVQYQCNVTGANVMIWRVINDSMTLDDQAYTTMSRPSSTTDVLGDAPEFSTVLSSVSSSPQLIMSSIIFTGQTNINGYTIECDDMGGDNEICPIVIPGIPSSPDNVTIHTDTFTNSSVSISWTESSSPCVTGYRYNISLSALEENIIMESTSNRVMVEGLVPSDDQYCVVVTAIDTGNRTSNGSDPVCFIFNVPQSVTNIIASNSTGSNKNLVSIIVTWDVPNDLTDCDFSPMLTGYEVSITASMPVDNLPGPVTLPPSATMHTFEDIPKGVNYTITVIARNGVGSAGSAESDNVFYEVPGTFVRPSTTTSSTTSSTSSSSSGIKSTSASTTSTSTSSSSRSATSTTPTTGIGGSTSMSSISVLEGAENKGLGVKAIVGIVVGVVILMLVMIAVIILVIVYFICCKRDRGSASD